MSFPNENCFAFTIYNTRIRIYIASYQFLFIVNWLDKSQGSIFSFLLEEVDPGLAGRCAGPHNSDAAERVRGKAVHWRRGMRGSATCVFGTGARFQRSWPAEIGRAHV